MMSSPNWRHLVGGMTQVRFFLLQLALIYILRLLLHTETPDGSVIPVWEEVQSQNVFAPKETMAARSSLGNGVELHYARIPITAERVPDFSDFSDLMGVVIRANATNTPIVLNCQLGRGRSTLTSVCFVKSPFCVIN
jgi:Inositol hexakisphosphate